MTGTEAEGEAVRYAAFDARYRGRDLGGKGARAALESLPVIDISPFVAGGSEAARRAVGRAVREACIDIGFFYLAGHGIAPAELDRVLEYGRRFFALPAEEKMKLHAGKGTGRLGFMQTGGIAPQASSARPPDLKERLSFSREVEPGEPEAGRFAAGRSQWPDAKLLPDFAPFLMAHIAKRVRLAQHMARAFATSLDLAEDYFDAMFRHLGCVLMFNHYPPLGRAAFARGQWSFTPHTDYGAFTLLLQDAAGGLEVRNAAGAWIAVPPRRGTFVVNIGDMFAMWTNDRYMSSLHRVLHFGDAERLSVPLFTYPNGTTVVRCLDTCHGPGNPPRYPPVVAEDYDRALVEQSSRTGRPGISSRTAERLVLI
ncbi:MAG TPA: 2-oxoglutarate and iron-dependent oxygenase domain-containing protein [Alphaproteobacteria bacterium]